MVMVCTLVEFALTIIGHVVLLKAEKKSATETQKKEIAFYVIVMMLLVLLVSFVCQSIADKFCIETNVREYNVRIRTTSDFSVMYEDGYYVWENYYGNPIKARSEDVHIETFPDEELRLWKCKAINIVTRYNEEGRFLVNFGTTDGSFRSITKYELFIPESALKD